MCGLLSLLVILSFYTSISWVRNFLRGAEKFSTLLISMFSPLAISWKVGRTVTYSAILHLIILECFMQSVHMHSARRNELNSCVD